MKDNFELCFTRLVGPDIEGGYTNHPADPGGPTNLGVTQAEYNAYRSKKGLGLQSVRYISRAEAKEIYQYQYWNTCKCDDLPSGVDWMVFDAAVNSGPVQSVKWLQRAINSTIKDTGYPTIDDDGHIGVITEQRVMDAYLHSPETLLSCIESNRMTMLQHLGTWPVFGKGWTNRVNLVHEQALEMIKTDGLLPRVPQYQFEEPANVSWWQRIWGWIRSML